MLEKSLFSAKKGVSYDRSALRPKNVVNAITQEISVGRSKSYASYAKTLILQRLDGNVGSVGNGRFLRFLRSAPLEGKGVGNVGTPFRVPTFLRPPLRRRFLGCFA